MAGLGINVNERGTELFIVMLVFQVLAWIFFLLRAYVKMFMIKKVAIEDWVMLFAILLYTVYGVIGLLGIVYGGTGEHVDQLTPEGAAIGLKAWYLCEVLYAPLSALVRTSVAVFLLKIAAAKTHRIIIYVNLAVIWILSIVYFFLMLLQCDPPSFFWEQVLGAPGHCLDPRVVPDATYAHSAIGAVCDWSLALLPIWMLWNVKLNVRTKVTIGILLSMGGVAGVALVIRIPYVKILAISPDFLFQTIDVAIWSVMEPSLGIIAGCVATLKPLFSSLGFGTSSTRRYAYGSKPKTASSSGAGGWRASRHMRKLDNLTANMDRYPAGPTDQTSTGSDIELQKSVQSPARTVAVSGPGSPATGWDVEQGIGAPEGWSTPWPGVRVQTSIDVSSQRLSSTQPQPQEHRPQQRQWRGGPESKSTSSSERVFPLQGERIVGNEGLRRP